MIRLGLRVRQGGRPLALIFFFFFPLLARVLVLATTQQSLAPRLATHLMASRPIALMCTNIVRSVPSVRASKDLLDPHWTTIATPPPQTRDPCTCPHSPCSANGRPLRCFTLVRKRHTYARVYPPRKHLRLGTDSAVSEPAL